MARPYTSHSIDQLETLFAEHAGSPLVVARLKEELSFRTTKRAQRLLDRVNALTAPESTKQHPRTKDERRNAAKDRSGAPPLQDHPLTRPIELEKVPSSPQDEFIDESTENSSRPHTLSTIRPVGTGGLPDAWARPLEQNLPALAVPGSSRPQIYCAALTALIAEIKKTGAGQKRYELEKGRRVEVSGSMTVYDFAFAEESGLFEDAKVDVEIPGQCLEGEIVSISSGRLHLALTTDQGPVLHRAVLVVDATALLEALREKIEQVASGELAANRALADAVIGEADPPPAPSRLSPPNTDKFLECNSQQTTAVEKALRDSITFIWGPPGTGKTTVLGHLVRAAFDGGRRVLICSNTHKAVDQVLLKICEELSTDSPRVSTTIDPAFAGSVADKRSRGDARWKDCPAGRTLARQAKGQLRRLHNS